MFTLHNGDCLPFLLELESGSIDAVITDPPYSSGGAFRSDRTNSTASKYLGSHGVKTQGQTLPEVLGDSRDTLGWAFWATLWATACHHALKESGVFMLFSDWRQLPNATNVIQAAGFVWRGIAVWDKGGSSRPMSGRFSHQAEYIVWGTKGAIGWDYEKESHRGVFTSNTVPAGDREHQTEKPLDVMSWLLGITEVGDTVLDPFMGSGTTGIACMRLGRKFVGCELSPEYFPVAEKRIREASLQQNLFTPSNNRLHLDVGDSPAQQALFTPEAGSAAGKSPKPAPRR